MSDTAMWLPVVAEALGVPTDGAGLRTHSFVALGGTSLQAIGLAAAGQRRLGRDADVAAILSERPLGEVLAEAPEFTGSAPPPAAGPGHRDLLPGQKAMLAAHVSGRDLPYHLMFTLATNFPLDLGRTRAALRALAARHESLRTMFVHGERGVARVVLPAPHEPRLLLQTLPDGADVLATVHDLYGPQSAALLHPFDAPPAVFVHTSAGACGLLTVLVHHVLADGWSIGVLLRDFAELYAGGELDARPSPEWVVARLAAATASGVHAAALGRVTARLAGAPAEVTLPTDLPPVVEADGRGARLLFTLSPGATSAAEGLARRAGVTVPTVLLSAWSLTVARRAGVDDLVLGVPAAGRFEAGMHRIVGLCTRVMPVRCRVTGQATPEAYLRACSAAVGAAVADADVAFEDVVTALGHTETTGHNPVAAIGFAAHHELVPATVAGWTVHEGHCGGAVFDALLYLQAWSNRPRLALEYATSVVTAAEAGELAESFQVTLVQLAEEPTVDEVSGLSAAQAARLAELGCGGEFTTADDMWSAFARHSAASPDAPAVADENESLTYAQLHGRALGQAAALRACGVEPGDRVLLDVARSVAEAVAVLAIARLGAAYVGVDRTATPEQRAHLARAAIPRARVADRSASPEWAGIPECAIVTGSEADAALPAHRPDPARTAYVSFTSGSTGTPKGVAITHRAVLRLAADPEMFADSTGTCLLRLAPMAFDASTLELLVPLARGDAVRVYPTRRAHTTGARGLSAPQRRHPSLADFRAVPPRRRAPPGRLLRAAAGVHRWRRGVAATRPPGTRPLPRPARHQRLRPDREHHVHDHLRRRHRGRGPRSATHRHAGARHDRAGRRPAGTARSARSRRRAAGVGPRSRRRLPRGARAHRRHVHRRGLPDRRPGPLGRPGAPAVPGPQQQAGQDRGPPGRTGRCGAADQGAAGCPGRGRVRRRRRADGDAAVRRGEDRTGHGPATDRAIGRGSLSRVLCLPEGVVHGGRFPAGPQREGRPARTGPTAARAGFRAATTARRDVAHRRGEPRRRRWTEALGTDDFDLDEGFFDVGGDSLSLAVARRVIQRRLGGGRLLLTDMYRFPTVQSLAQHLHLHLAGTPS